MQLVLVLSILAALVIADNVPSEPVSGAGWRLGIVVAGAALVATLAFALSRSIAGRLRRDFDQKRVLLRRFRTWRRIHAAIWLAVAGGTFYGLGWAQMVRFNWRLDRAVLVDELLILAPLLVPLILSWAAYYEVDRVVRRGPSGDDSPALEPFTRWQYVGLHLRHYLGILLLPVLGLLAIEDAAELLAPGILETRYAMAVYVPPVVLLFVLFPCLLRRVWKTWPLPPGALRGRLEAAAKRAGFRASEILVWHTGGMVMNAAVAGFLPRLRCVFLTDGLLAQLADEEIEAVFGHEIGHVRHRHLLLRVLAMIAPVSLVLVAQQAFPTAVGHVEQWLAAGGLGVQAPMGVLMLVAMGLYVFLVFGAYSRLLEGQADLFGCRALACGGDAGAMETFTSALEKIAAASGVDRRAPGWQHASIARRVGLLDRVASDPRYGRRFQRRVDLASGLMVAIVFSPLACRLLLG
jgi:STE24 endopeptidase